MSTINLTVNGQSHTVDVDPTTPLLYVLSDDLALNGPKFGCGLGPWGAGTAILNGAAAPPLPAPRQHGHQRRHPHARGARKSREAASDPESVHRRAGRAVRLLR